jgi:hypothetical protein
VGILLCVAVFRSNGVIDIRPAPYILRLLVLREIDRKREMEKAEFASAFWKIC